jgi:hypothetical protein
VTLPCERSVHGAESPGRLQVARNHFCFVRRAEVQAVDGCRSSGASGGGLAEWSRRCASSKVAKLDRRKHKRRGVRIRRLFVAMGVAGCIALAAPVFAGAINTKVTIKEDHGDFHGKVFSRKRKCEGRGVVTVYKLQGTGAYHPATDKKIGSDMSEGDGDHGVWSVNDTGARRGRCYAMARRSPGCTRGFSKIA